MHRVKMQQPSTTHDGQITDQDERIPMDLLFALAPSTTVVTARATSVCSTDVEVYERSEDNERSAVATTRSRPQPGHRSSGSPSTQQQGSGVRGPDALERAIGGRRLTPALISIERQEDGPALPLVPPRLADRLELVRGIGPWHAASLRAEGYATLRDVVRHPQFGADAVECLAAIAARRGADLKRRGAPSEEVIALFAPEELVVIDIETMGLGFGEEVFLIGLLTCHAGAWRLTQLLLTDLAAQDDLLVACLRQIEAFAACVTYNGSTFDLPFLRAAAELQGLTTTPFDRLFHCDLLYTMRRQYGATAPDCRLTTMATHILGIERTDDLPGLLVPSEFDRYLRTGHISILRRILEHNRQDLLDLRDLLWCTRRFALNSAWACGSART